MSKPKSPRSLVDFARAKRRSGCKVCKLPPPIADELKAARDRKVPRAVQLEWLNTEHGLKITGMDLDMHRNGRHDYD